MHTHSELPSLRASVRLQGTPALERIQWYDVKFYPYTAPGDDPVFAAVGGRIILVCRCLLDATSAVEVIRVFEDEEEKNSDPEGTPVTYNSVEWSRAENGDPLVCATGNSQIKVLNIITGKLVTTLIGHGESILDLAISPLDPTILASGSADHSLRIWSLDPAHQRQPTAAIFFGQGHRDQVLSIAYHSKGRYILSAGMDTGVNLWRVPDDLREYMGTDKPALVHYPHFSTTEVHTDFVDCVRWYNDLVISHAARENKIQLWRIENFQPDLPPPHPAPIPHSTTVNSQSRVTVAASSIPGTRSAWGGRFQRLVQFDLPHHTQFYIRFSLFHELGAHPILVAGNEKSRIFLWDLQAVEALGVGDMFAPASHAKAKDESSKVKEDAKDKKVLPRHIREASTASTTSGTSGAHSTLSAYGSGRGRGGRPPRPTRGIGDPFHSVDVHQEIMLHKYSSAFRQFAWSRDGQWCIGVGDFSLITVLHRWEHGVPPPETMVGRKKETK